VTEISCEPILSWKVTSPAGTDLACAWPPIPPMRPAAAGNGRFEPAVDEIRGFDEQGNVTLGDLGLGWQRQHLQDLGRLRRPQVGGEQ